MPPQLFSSTITYLNNHKKIVGVVIVLTAIIVGYRVFWGVPPADTSNAFTVKRVDLSQEVAVTGAVKASSVAMLSFEKSGRVARVYSREGAAVEQGQLIVSLENSDLSAAAHAAEADVDQTKANLAALLAGDRPEDVRVKEAELAVATQTLKNYYTGGKDALEDAYAKTDDATRVKLSGIYTTSGSSYGLSFSSCNTQDTIDATWKRFLIDQSLIKWRMELNSWDAKASDEQDVLIQRSSAHITDARDLLETTNRLLTATCTITNSGLDTYRTNLTTARTSLNTVASTINTLGQNIASQKLALEKTRSELSLKKAPPTTESVDAQKAVVASAEARAQQARVALRNTEIRSPFSGVITKVDAEQGEIMTPGVPVVTVMSRSHYEVEANIPEADIAKLSKGNTADVTLDAYGEDAHFSAKLYFIDPAETVIDGVPTYRIKLQFTQDDPRIKSGMTANMQIVTATRTNVLAIPQRSITQKSDGTKVVFTLLPDGTTKEAIIQTGLRGSDGKVEILSGISEGDKISLVAQTGAK